MQMPQPGERWRVRPRPSPEFTCPNCGNPYGSKLPVGAIVTARAGLATMFRCGICAHQIPMPDGMVLTNLVGKKSGLQVAIPFNWLEPVVED